MKGWAIMGKYISRIGILAIVFADTYTVYLFTESMSSFVIVPTVLAVTLAILNGITMLSLKSVSVNRVPVRDGSYLQECFNDVCRRANCNNSISLYISNCSELPNAYTVGRKVIVNRALLELDNNTVSAVLAHELAHVNNFDSYFKGLVQLNLLIGSAILIGIQLGTALIIGIIVLVIIALCFNSEFVAFSVAKGAGKVIGWIGKAVFSIYLFVYKMIAAIFFRAMENTADRYAVELGYGFSLRNYIDAYDVYSDEVTFSEKLLLDHPDRYTRIRNIENYDYTA